MVVMVGPTISAYKTYKIIRLDDNPIVSLCAIFICCYTLHVNSIESFSTQCSIIATITFGIIDLKKKLGINICLLTFGTPFEIISRIYKT